MRHRQSSSTPFHIQNCQGVLFGVLAIQTGTCSEEVVSEGGGCLRELPWTDCVLRSRPLVSCDQEMVECNCNLDPLPTSLMHGEESCLQVGNDSGNAAASFAPSPFR